MLFRSFYDEQVRLNTKQRQEMHDRRDTNRDRLVAGLKKNESPLPSEHLIQGSYAMWTMVQRPNNDYDIDDGAVFKRDDLKGSQGADKTPLAARKMVCDALQDERFNKQPEVRSKCVRVFYNEGFHIDVPVYRTYKEDDENEIKELAASDWKNSDPDKITNWFKDSVVAKSPDETNGRQMRRLVCLIKKWACSRDSWNLPCGLVLSTLVDEKYCSALNRDDESFVSTLKSVRDRLVTNKIVYNPVDNNEKFSDGREHQIQNLYDKLDTWLPVLEVLEEKDCTKNKAMNAWNSFFHTDYFDKFKDKDTGGKSGGFLAAGSEAGRVKKGGQEGFA